MYKGLRLFLGDSLGIFSSSVCLVHCVFHSIGLVLLPIFEWAIFGGTLFHGLMLLLVLPMAAMALWHGVKEHGEYHVLCLGLSGAVLLVAGALAVPVLDSETLDLLFSVFGSCLLILAHYRNMKRLLRVKEVFPA